MSHAMPSLCAHHRTVYATRARRLHAHPVRRPDGGWKALRREAATVAGQCPACGSANA